MEDDERLEVILEVKEELLKLQEDGSTEEVTLERQPPEKRFLGVGLSDSESEEGELASGGAAEEINKYKQEKRISSESCPLEWWRNRRTEYPLMSRLARKYLSVQATSTAAERAMSNLNLMLDKRRHSMKADLFDQLIFLGDL